MSANLLQGKNVAITGATTGIGRAIAIGMAQQGANIAVLYLPAEYEHVRTLEEEINAIRNSTNVFVGVPGDVSNPEDSLKLVNATVEKFSTIDVMVANAGICQYRDFLSAPPEFYYKHIRVNLDGVYFAVQAAGNQMKKQGNGGSIIATASIRSLRGGSQVVEYTASKGGVLSIVQAAAVALGPMGIRVNALLPGTIHTPMLDEAIKDEGQDISKLVRNIPLGRLGQPKDIAGPAIFLASDMSEYMNGSQMLVDGGLFVNLE
jgi:L-rhamnose 1-dehydrogenase